jgi:hypothetical protein
VLTPDTDQRRAIERMAGEPTRAALNASQYGTGKTLVTVEVGRAIRSQVNLVVAPLFTKYSWRSTILAQIPDAQVAFINSTKAGKDAFERLLLGTPGWYIIGREYFATSKVAIPLAAKQNLIDYFVYDECAKWANRKSAGFRVMRSFNKVGYKMALSATPYGNKFTGMWAIHQWLWPKLEGHGSFWSWVGDWCATEIDPFAGVVVTDEKNPGSFVRALPCYVRLEKDFGEPEEITYSVDLSAAERRVYDQFEKHLIAWIGDNPLVTTFPAVKRVRLRQMSLGSIQYTVDDEGRDNVSFDPGGKSTKYDTLVEILRGEATGEPAIVFTHSQKFAAVVVERLERDGFRAREWSGNISESIRHATKEEFVSGAIDYIIATPSAIGEGVDGLQSRARLMIWLSQTDDNSINQQAFRRLYRRGQTRQVINIHIVANDTYDEGVLSSQIQQTLTRNKVLKANG